MSKNYRVGLVGESHYQENIDARTEGCRVTLIAEPDNQFDPRAVRVDDQWGRTLGYLPRDGWLTAALLDQKKEITASVSSVTRTRGKPTGIVIEVGVEKGNGPANRNEPSGIDADPAGLRSGGGMLANNQSLGGRKMNLKRGLMYAGAGLLGLAVLGVAFGDGKESADGGKETEAAAEATVPVEAVTAQELFKAFDENEVAANRRFEGKLVEVSGTIQSISAGIGGDPVVALKTENEFMPARIYLDEDSEDAVATLKQGQELTARCESASVIIGSPSLNDCVLK